MNLRVWSKIPFVLVCFSGEQRIYTMELRCFRACGLLIMVLFCLVSLNIYLDQQTDIGETWLVQNIRQSISIAEIDNTPNLEMVMRGIDIAKKRPLGSLNPNGDPSSKNRLFDFRSSEDCDHHFSFVQTSRRLVCTVAFDSVSWGSLEEYIHGSDTASMSSWSLGYTG